MTMIHPFKIGQVWKTKVESYFFNDSEITIMGLTDSSIIYQYPKGHKAWDGLHKLETSWSKSFDICLSLYEQGKLKLVSPATLENNPPVKVKTRFQLIEDD